MALARFILRLGGGLGMGRILSCPPRLHEGVQYKQAAFDARLQVSWL